MNPRWRSDSTRACPGCSENAETSGPRHCLRCSVRSTRSNLTWRNRSRDSWFRQRLDVMEAWPRPRWIHFPEIDWKRILRTHGELPVTWLFVLGQEACDNWISRTFCHPHCHHYCYYHCHQEQLLVDLRIYFPEQKNVSAMRIKMKEISHRLKLTFWWWLTSFFSLWLGLGGESVSLTLSNLFSRDLTAADPLELESCL